MIHAFKVAEPTLLIIYKQSLTAASKAAQKIWLPQTQLLLIDGHVDGYDSLRKFVTGETQSFGLQIPKWNLAFQLGTTGLPKVVGSSFFHKSKTISRLKGV
jgi:hypothetical protein